MQYDTDALFRFSKFKAEDKLEEEGEKESVVEVQETKLVKTHSSMLIVFDVNR
jgi:hypothetical protein